MRHSFLSIENNYTIPEIYWKVQYIFHNKCLIKKILKYLKIQFAVKSKLEA